MAPATFEQFRRQPENEFLFYKEEQAPELFNNFRNLYNRYLSKRTEYRTIGGYSNYFKVEKGGVIDNIGLAKEFYNIINEVNSEIKILLGRVNDLKRKEDKNYKKRTINEIRIHSNAFGNANNLVKINSKFGAIPTNITSAEEKKRKYEADQPAPVYIPPTPEEEKDITKKPAPVKTDDKKSKDDDITKKPAPAVEKEVINTPNPETKPEGVEEVEQKQEEEIIVKESNDNPAPEQMTDVTNPKSPDVEKVIKALQARFSNISLQEIQDYAEALIDRLELVKKLRTKGIFNYLNESKVRMLLRQSTNFSNFKSSLLDFIDKQDLDVTKKNELRFKITEMQEDKVLKNSYLVQDKINLRLNDELVIVEDKVDLSKRPDNLSRVEINPVVPTEGPSEELKARFNITPIEPQVNRLFNLEKIQQVEYNEDKGYKEFLDGLPEEQARVAVDFKPYQGSNEMNPFEQDNYIARPIDLENPFIRMDVEGQIYRDSLLKKFQPFREMQVEQFEDPVKLRKRQMGKNEAFSYASPEDNLQRRYNMGVGQFSLNRLKSEKSMENEFMTERDLKYDERNEFIIGGRSRDNPFLKEVLRNLS